jgi:LuxR family quorum-sensing transcriptional regulator LasR
LLFSTPRKYGFSHVFFSISRNDLLGHFHSLIVTNQAPEVQEVYKQHHFRAIDPFINHCRKSHVPLVWSESNFTSLKQKVYYKEISRLGVSSGICVPIHGANGEIGILNFTSENMKCGSTGRNKNFRLEKFSILRDYLLESYIALGHHESDEIPTPNLTPRELECLRWIAEGKTSWEVSRILSCAEVTVNYHIGNIIRKFNVQSRQHAVLLSLKAGIVSLNGVTSRRRAEAVQHGCHSSVR